MKWYEILFLIVWILIPILGVVGYFNNIMWLFYVAGVITILITCILLYFGEFGCFTTLFLLVSLAIGYFLTGTIWDGLLLGSCILFSVLYIFMIVMMFLSGVSTVMGIFKKNNVKL